MLQENREPISTAIYMRSKIQFSNLLQLKKHQCVRSLALPIYCYTFGGQQARRPDRPIARWMPEILDKHKTKIGEQ